MQHVHVANIRPDAVYKTGVIRPWPAQTSPAEVARRTAANFAGRGRGRGRGRQSSPGPEYIVRRAQRIAEGMARGKKPPRGTNARILQAARFLLEGRGFKVHAGGRMFEVAARQPGTWTQQIHANPASQAVRR